MYIGLRSGRDRCIESQDNAAQSHLDYFVHENADRGTNGKYLAKMDSQIIAVKTRSACQASYGTAGER